MEKKLTIISKLAAASGRNDETLNLQLAQSIAKKGDEHSVLELVENLSNKDKAIQSDCIKVLYEIGRINPKLIGDHGKTFTTLLKSKNNRLQWGAMMALDSITLANPKFISKALVEILDCADRGSVITKDYAIGILCKLGTVKAYREQAFLLLFDLLKLSATNQLPMYAEKILPLVSEKEKASFVKILSSRLSDFDTGAKRSRIEKVIRKLSQAK